MRRPLTLLAALALCLLACGHYGRPERPGPHATTASEAATTASEAADTAVCEETEKSE